MAKKYLRLPLLALILFSIFTCILFTNHVFADEPTTSIETSISPESSSETTSNQPSNTDNSSQDLTCYNQTGAVGWVVCPATEFIAKVVDTVYGLISQFLIIKPILLDTSSTIHTVWNYIRNLTNIIFVIFILIIVFSQLTGFGINSYGIKKTLPRVIIAGILINLSYIICSLAVDVSNILGSSIVDFFTSIETSAATSTTIADGTTVAPTWVTVTSVILGGASTVAIGGVAVAAVGGFTALLFMLIPIAIGAIIAVLVAFLMVALRQALVILLVMVAPLAFASYLLPNTEKFFSLWKKLFVAMVTFFPLFSLLYGASSLAGWAIIAAADNLLWLLIGMAVQVLPLIFSIPLMKTSGTFLDKAGNFLGGVGKQITGATLNWATPHTELSRAKYLANKPNKYNLPQRTSQWLQNRKARVASDTAIYQTIAKKRGEAYASEYKYSNNTFNRIRKRAGKVSKRGEKLYTSQENLLANEAIIKHNTTSFDEGISQDAYNDKQKSRLNQADSNIINASDKLRFETARALDVNLENLKSYESRVNQAQNEHVRGLFSERYQTMLDTAGIRGGDGVNTIISNAIALRAKARQEITGDYLTLFNEASYTSDVHKFYCDALDRKDPSILQAGLQVGMIRGDYDVVMDNLFRMSANIHDITPENLTMQKTLCDTLLPVKQDAALLSLYAKCNNKARGKAQNARNINQNLDDQVAQGVITQAEANQQYKVVQPDNFTFEDFLQPDGEAAQFGLDVFTLLGQEKSSDIAAVQDKTVWDFAKEHDELYFTDKQRRDAIFSYPTNGEQFRYLLDVHLGKGSKWDDKNKRQKLTFESQEALDKARNNIQTLIGGCNTRQIASFKTDSISTFATVLSDCYTTNQDGSITFDVSTKELLSNAIQDGVTHMNFSNPERLKNDLRRMSQRGNLDSMNASVRTYLNSFLHFDD